MANSLLTVNGTEVSVEDSGKTVVNISISQESSLAYLAKAVAGAVQKKPRGNEPAPTRSPEISAASASATKAQCSGEQKVLGAVQIVLGVMCLGLGGVLYLLPYFLPAKALGAPFWLGSLFVVSGFLSVLSERRGGCWVHLATLFNLASVLACCVGLASGLVYVTYISHWTNDLDKKLLSGVHILLLIVAVAAMGITVFSFVHGLRVLCCRQQANIEDYVATGDPEVPPPYEELAEEKMSG